VGSEGIIALPYAVIWLKLGEKRIGNGKNLTHGVISRQVAGAFPQYGAKKTPISVIHYEERLRRVIPYCNFVGSNTGEKANLYEGTA
jgi:hypothetical protein